MVTAVNPMRPAFPLRWVWRRSSSCEGGACLEVRATAGGVEVRDSKAPSGPVLTFTDADWSAFLAAVKAGELDVLAAGGVA